MGNDYLGALASGLVLGAATGLPLGVVNVAVVEAATRAGRRPAAAIGIGGAIADGVHAALAFAGVAAVITRYPEVRRAMLVASVIVVVAYAAVVWLRRGERLARGDGREAPTSTWRAVLLGASLTLPNPAAMAAWVVVAGALPHGRLPVAVVGAIGVAIGSAAWFATLAHLAARHALEGAAARRLARAVAVLLVALAAFAIAREVL